MTKTIRLKDFKVIHKFQIDFKKPIYDITTFLK